MLQNEKNSQHYFTYYTDKYTSMPNRKACIALAVLIGLAFFAAFHHKGPRIPGASIGSPLPPFSMNNSDRGVQTAYWQTRIAAIGGSAAYREFSSVLVKNVPDAQVQHFISHLFGNALYKQEGMSAIGVCDDQFTWGCFHEFVGQAFAEHGISAALTLNERCADQGVGDNFIICQHGIGHGLAAYFGYTVGDLVKALDECHKLPYVPVLEGCYTGACMEYNERSMLGVDARVRPQTNREDFYSPCNQIPDTYQPACYFRQARWWVPAVFTYRNTVQIYPRMGELCHGAGKPEWTRTCIEGVGAAASGPAFEDPTVAAELCGAVSTLLSEQLLCQSFAAYGIYISGETARALESCSNLTGDSKIYCDQYASGKTALVEQPLPAGL